MTHHSNNPSLQMNISESFLMGQLELYKIEFSETNNNDYLYVMNEFNNAIYCFRHLRERVKDLALQNSLLEQENNRLKKINEA